MADQSLFPQLLPTSVPGKMKGQTLGPVGILMYWIHLLKSGAGEGIRTLDPNLGKVVLYP